MTRNPKSLVEFIMEAIDEAAPGRGAEIYWLAFRRFNDYVAGKQRAEAERDLERTAGPAERKLKRTARLF